ncbi:Adenylosuccinate synthetase [Trichoderma barbatum]
MPLVILYPNSSRIFSNNTTTARNTTTLVQDLTSNTMTITVILGAQWGDEGKGKLSDILTPEAQVCARAAGGHNAGHSVVANGVSYSFHLLPSGFISPKCMNFIGSGVVFHCPAFFRELQDLEDKGLPNVRERILVSDRCHIVTDLQVAVDGLEERELGERQIGTTRRGIGPTYSTKHARSGIRLAEIFNAELFESKLRSLERGFRKRYGELLEYDLEEELERFKTYRSELAKYAVDQVSFIQSVQKDNLNICVEGANALMLDIDMGSYPFVTSSSTTIGGIISGLSLNPRDITETIGVVKAYTTRVGAGAFKTEDTGDIGTKLQDIGREWGTSTGRRRRCGWLDLVVLKYSCSINYYDSLNLTKLDVLDTFDTIKVAIAYRSEGAELDYYPANLEILDQAEVVYKEFPGWQESTTNCRSYSDLPQKARDYIEFIEKFVGVKVKWIGTGPDREAMITRA